MRAPARAPPTSHNAPAPLATADASTNALRHSTKGGGGPTVGSALWSQSDTQEGRPSGNQQQDHDVCRNRGSRDRGRSRHHHVHDQPAHPRRRTRRHRHRCPRHGRLDRTRQQDTGRLTADVEGRGKGPAPFTSPRHATAGPSPPMKSTPPQLLNSRRIQLERALQILERGLDRQRQQLGLVRV